MISNKKMKQLGLQAIQIIAEASFAPTIGFKYLNGDHESIRLSPFEDETDVINKKISEIEKKILLKERLEKLKNIR